ncbi:hypothetical protein Ancab_024454 [Ancistrocladus abbreviatus]
MGGAAWTEEEDHLLRKCVEQYGEGKWHRVPLLAGLQRCRKSCRLRWLNYLRPNIKRGKFAEEEVELIVKLHNLLGNKWSLIAGRLPGRTANDVKNYWNCHLSKKLDMITNDAKATKEAHNLGGSSMQFGDTGGAPGCEPHQEEDAASTTKGGTYGLVLQKEEDQDKFSFVDEGLGKIEELGVNFELDELKMMGEDHCKSKWDLDDLMMDVELWTE